MERLEMVAGWRFLAVCMLAVFALPGAAFAACVDGAGGSATVTLGSCSTAGEWDYDTGNSTFKFCNGTDWISMEGTTGGSCSTAGVWQYDSGNNTYEFCDGTNWVDVADNGTLGSCSNEAEQEYDTGNSVMKFCNGTNWIDMTATSGGSATCLVFVTSTTYKGNLGGVSGADSKCGTRASAAGFSGTYKAWVAESASQDPESTFSQSSGPYKRTDGETIADDWADLTDGTIDREIDLDEFGNAPSAFNVWSNVKTDGTNRTSTDCSNWTTNNGGSQGRNGSYGNTDNQWTEGGVNSCNVNTALYCFEQP